MAGGEVPREIAVPLRIPAGQGRELRGTAYLTGDGIDARLDDQWSAELLARLTEAGGISKVTMTFGLQEAVPVEIPIRARCSGMCTVHCAGHEEHCSAEQMLRELHAVHGIHGGLAPQAPAAGVPEDLRKLRMDFLDEEVTELRGALAGDDIVKVADALADITCVVAGTAVLYGIPFDAVLAEVHRSNLTKGRTSSPGGASVPRWEVPPVPDETWAPGDRVVVMLPDRSARRGRGGHVPEIPVTGTVREVDPPGQPRGVLVDLDREVNGVRDCYASHGELRREARDAG